MKGFFTIVILLVASTCYAQQSLYNREIKADIQMEEKSEFLTIKGVAENLTDLNTGLRYELSVIKKDSLNNISKNKQEGSGVLNAKNKVVLATTSVNLNIPETLTIMLLIYDYDDKLIGKSIERIEPYTRQLKKPVVDTYDGIVFLGIVENKTRTSPGRKFYDYFYGRYNYYQLKGNQTVKIKEVFGQGRSSRIEIYLGYKLVFQFFLNPKKEYIKAMGDQAISIVYQELQKLKSAQ